MTNYIFSVIRLGEKEEHIVNASSEDDAWKRLVKKVNLDNVDKIIIVTYG